jgi:hypothetical protein
MANILEIPPLNNLADDGNILEIPPPPVGYILFDTNTNFELQSEQQFQWPDAPPCPGANPANPLDHGNCVIVFHEAITGWWVVGPAGTCSGQCCDCGQPLAVCAGCFPIDSCLGWAAGNLGNSPQQLFDIFPGWALVDAGIDGTQQPQFDAWFFSCDVTTIITWNGPTKKSLNCQPPLVLINGVCACPNGQAMTAGGGCITMDPPIPAPLRNLSGGSFSLNLVRMGVPTPLAPDGIGWESPTFPAPLPVHPVLSADAVRATCGTCGDNGDATESEEIDI